MNPYISAPKNLLYFFFFLRETCSALQSLITENGPHPQSAFFSKGVSKK